MGRGKKHQPEQVVNLLRQIEVAVANGKTTALACKETGIVEQTYFRWRKEYGGLQVDQAKRLTERRKHSVCAVGAGDGVALGMGQLSVHITLVDT